MRRPNLENEHSSGRVIRTCNGVQMTESYKDMIRRKVQQRKFDNTNYFQDPVEEELINAVRETDLSVRRRHKPVPREIREAVDSVCFIAEHLKKDDKENSVISQFFFSVFLCFLFL